MKINNSAVLEQGVKFNPSQVGIQKVSALGTLKVGENNIGKLADVGIFISNEISKQNRREAEKEYNTAVREREKIIGENQNIVFNQAKDLINVQATKFENSLTGNDYLDEAGLSAKRMEWHEALRGLISKDSIMTGEQKEQLKVYLGQKNNGLDKNIVSKSYQARVDKSILDLENQREDNKIAIGMAIQNGNQESANELIVQDRNYRKSLQKLNPERYNNEWDNKQGNDLTIYAGYGIIHKSFVQYQDEYLKDPTEENYKAFQRKIFDAQHQFVNPEFLKANFGSEHGLETPEFEDDIRILANKVMADAKSRGKAKKDWEVKVKQKNAFDFKNNALSSYAVENGIKRVPPEAFSPEGNILSTSYIRTNEALLKEKGLIDKLHTNQDLQNLLEKDSSLPRPEFNIIGDSGIKAITNLYDTGDYKELESILDTQYGIERTEQVNSMIDEELMRATGGKINMSKMKALTEDDGTEQTANFREATMLTRNMENLGISRDRVKSLSSKDMLTKDVWGSDPTIRYSEIDSLRTLTLDNKSASMIVNQIEGDTKSVATVLAYQNMTESQRKSFMEANTSQEQAEKISDFLQDNPNVQKDVRKYYNSIMQNYLGDERPFRINGYSFLANKNNYNEDYLKKSFKNITENDKLYFEREGSDVAVGTGNAMNSTRLEPNGEGGFNITLQGKILYRKVDGIKEPATINPLIEKPEEAVQYEEQPNIFNMANFYTNELLGI